MILEGHTPALAYGASVETTCFKEFIAFLQPFGLDTAEEHRLLDQHITFETKMKVSLLKAYLLKPGVKVRVQYDPTKSDHVTMDDEPTAILERNPQLKK